MGAVQGHPLDDGYGVIGVALEDGRRTMALVHRVAFYLTHGRWPEPEALHSCDVRLCINPDHVGEGTRSENMQQVVARGHHVSGYGLAARNGTRKPRSH